MKRAWSLLWAARLVSKWEGLILMPILDTIASPPVWTAGYGHTDYAGPPKVLPGQLWSKAKALRVLAHDCRAAAASVAELVKHRLTVRQRMALISFVFNLGPNVLPGSDLLAALNAGKMALAARLMLNYDHGGNGEVVQGLSNRRHAEAWLMTHSNPRHRVPQKPSPADHVHTRAHRRPARASK